MDRQITYNMFIYPIFECFTLIVDFDGKMSIFISYNIYKTNIHVTCIRLLSKILLTFIKMSNELSEIIFSYTAIVKNLIFTFTKLLPAVV